MFYFAEDKTNKEILIELKKSYLSYLFRSIVRYIDVFV